MGVYDDLIGQYVKVYYNAGGKERIQMGFLSDEDMHTIGVLDDRGNKIPLGKANIIKVIPR